MRHVNRAIAFRYLLQLHQQHRFGGSLVDIVRSTNLLTYLQLQLQNNLMLVCCMLMLKSLLHCVMEASKNL